MKERPILFNTPMVQALLDGRKTQTRRIVKLPKNHRWGTEYDGQVIYNDGSTFGADIEVDDLRCPYGDIGDRLWVRETYCNVVDGHGDRTIYKADCSDNTKKNLKGVWKPSIFMPRTASRILIEITALRVERLHDISEQDAIAEGIECEVIDQSIDFKDYLTRNTFNTWFEDDAAQKSYFSLWESINGRPSLESNPWVWVIEFKRIEK